MAVCIVLVAILLPAHDAPAQQAGVEVQQGPHYVGEPVLIRVTAEDFDDAADQPTCESGSLPQGLSLKLIGVSPSRSRFTRVINGRVSSYTRVVHAFDFQALVSRPGVYTVPPFTVRQGNRVVKAGGFDLRVEKVATDGQMQIALVLPSSAIYPGQHVPVTVEWWYAGDTNEVRNLSIRSPLFDRFTFIDEPVVRSGTTLPIQTEKGTIRLKAEVQRRVLNGKPFVVVSATRLLVVEKPGEHKLEPITASIEKVTRWGRDLFGDRRPATTARRGAVGSPVTLVIKPLPLKRAPSGFAGAVGRGFAVEIQADRSVVTVGDPITLTVTLRGDGNLESAGLPALSALLGGVPNGVAGTAPAGLDLKKFRLPKGDVAGTLLKDGSGKTFVVTVRVLDETVTEIPPVTYSWFDPQQERFQTTRSDPIALRILPAQMVDAQSVVTAAPERPKSDSDAFGRGLSTPTQTMPRPVSLDATAADLAIVSDPSRLLIADSHRLGGPVVRAGIYFGSVLLVLLAWTRRRAASIDPELARRRRVLKEHVKLVAAASNLPRPEAASQIAAALRQMTVHADSHGRIGIDRLLAECDVLAFAPDADRSETIDPSLHDRAVDLARMIAKGTR